MGKPQPTTPVPSRPGKLSERDSRDGSGVELHEDWGLSPYTGWTRQHWVGLAERMLGAARKCGSANHAQIHFPGAEGGYGHLVDGLEGFARTFLASGFLAAGSQGQLGGLDWYAEGFRYGPDPTLDPTRRWVRPLEHDQAKVEACSLALILHLTRPYLWDQLDSRTQEMTIDYLAEWIHASYPKNNWVWFRLITGQFLKSVGGPWSPEDQAEDLAFNESCYVDNGWYRDGMGRCFDYYSAWVFQVYPLLWCDIAPDDPESRRLRPIFQQRLDRYLADFVLMIGADGAMLAQGRSLIYRFAAAATLWMGAWTGSPTLEPGLVRRAASGIVRHFVDRAVPDANGVLSMGWYAPWRALAQSYSGPGSPYWACKGLLGLALPADHPVWTATEQALPSDAVPVGTVPVVPQTLSAGTVPSGTATGYTLANLAAPGWICSTTTSDGIARIINHGTDHAHQLEDRADSPLYANIGYSTATFPLLDADAWTTPLAQSVCLIDAQGRASHRTGFTPLGTGIAGPPEPSPWSHPGIAGPPEPSPWSQSPQSHPAYSPQSHPAEVGIAASRAQAHWVDPAPIQHLHGAGYTGSSSPAAIMTVISLVRGPWELRSVLLESVSEQALTLRVGGWAVTGEEFASATSSDETAGYATVQIPRPGNRRLVSAIRAIATPSTAGIRFINDASPLEPAEIPCPGCGAPDWAVFGPQIPSRPAHPRSEQRISADSLAAVGGSTAVPYLDFPVQTGDWVSMLVTLSGQVSSADAGEECRVAAEIAQVGPEFRVHVIWPDGVDSECWLPTGRRPGPEPSGPGTPTVPSRTSRKGEKQ